jgi:hypothetical protein
MSLKPSISRVESIAFAYLPRSFSSCIIFLISSESHSGLCCVLRFLRCNSITVSLIGGKYMFTMARIGTAYGNAPVALFCCRGSLR